MRSLSQTTGKNALNEQTKLIVLAMPIFIEQFLGVLLNNLDTLMISGYSQNAVGSVGNANMILNLVNLIFNIIGVATGVVVSQYLGAKLFDKMDRVYSMTFILNFGFGFALSSALFLLARPILNLIGVPAELMPDAVSYMRIVGGTMFLQAGFNVMIQILRCNGLQKIGVLIAFMMNVLNVVGNYCFLFGPLAFLELGVAGVAISTSVSRVLALTVALVVFFCEKLGKIKLSELVPFDFGLLQRILRVGIPSAGESISYSLYQIVLLSFVNEMGTDSINARIYCNTLMAFAVVFGSSVATASQIITGYLIGAGKPNEAYKRIVRYCLICIPVAIFLTSINWLATPFTFKLFTDNQNVIDLSFKIMFVAIFLEIGRTLNMIILNSLKATGDVRFFVIVSALCMWGVGLGGGYLFGVVLKFGVVGIFMGTALDELCRGICYAVRWKHKRWMKHIDKIE